MGKRTYCERKTAVAGAYGGRGERGSGWRDCPGGRGRLMRLDARDMHYMHSLHYWPIHCARPEMPSIHEWRLLWRSIDNSISSDVGIFHRHILLNQLAAANELNCSSRHTRCNSHFAGLLLPHRHIIGRYTESLLCTIHIHSKVHPSISIYYGRSLTYQAISSS